MTEDKDWAIGGDSGWTADSSGKDFAGVGTGIDVLAASLVGEVSLSIMGNPDSGRDGKNSADPARCKARVGCKASCRLADSSSVRLTGREWRGRWVRCGLECAEAGDLPLDAAANLRSRAITSDAIRGSV